MCIGVCIGLIATLLKQSIQGLDALRWYQTKSYLKVPYSQSTNALLVYSAVQLGYTETKAQFSLPEFTARELG